MTGESKSADVIVVGAGMAGLKTAMELEAQGKSVLVLEARDRVGGRLMPGEIAGQVIDRGGQWVGPTQKLLLLMMEYLPMQRVSAKENHFSKPIVLHVTGFIKSS